MIAKLILSGNFEAAEAAFAEADAETALSEIVEVAFDQPSILFYAFACHLLTQEETAERHYMAANLMSTALNHLPDGYEVAFHHMNRALALDPGNVAYKMDMLLCYDIPECLLSPSEAQRIAHEVLSEASDHKVAQSVIQRCVQ